MSTRDKPDNAATFDALNDVTILTDPIDLLPYRRDTSAVPAGEPQAVARPRNAEAVVDLMTVAERDRMPVYVRGGGSMYAGGVNPHAGGVVLDMTGLDRIIDIDLSRGIVVCEPGVRFGALLKALQPHGQTIGIVPLTGPTGTIGGSVSAHALGTGSARFQSFADEVAGLDVVLPGGQRVQTGSAAAPGAGYFHRNCIGPDLTGLFLGADATFGVVVGIALWLHPLPAHRQSACFGFPDRLSAANCIGEIQRRELLRNTWYASGYEAQTIHGRMQQAFPERPVESLPDFALAMDFGGERHHVEEDEQLIAEIVRQHGGEGFPEFNEIYFSKLRYDETYWYAFAGYFVLSRCAILMSSLPTDKLPAFLDVIAEQRERHNGYVWGAAAVVCRRGLHGGVITFYDEATQWDEVHAAVSDCADKLIAAGCVPYKSGKVWAQQVGGFEAYSTFLRRLKDALDPHGILSPGNLGL